MTHAISNLKDLKEFLNSLTDEQLSQPVRLNEIDRVIYSFHEAEIVDDDMINPSGEVCEKRSLYLPGGEYYEEGMGFEDESIVFPKGSIFFNIPA